MHSIFVSLVAGIFVYPTEKLEKNNLDPGKTEFTGLDLNSLDFEEKKFSIASIAEWHPSIDDVETSLRRGEHHNLETKHQMFVKIRQTRKELSNSTNIDTVTKRNTKQKKHCHHRVAQPAYAH